MPNLVVVKFCLISILVILFIYQSRRTILKYQAGKTNLQVNSSQEKLRKKISIIFINWKVTLTDNECGRNLYDAFQVTTLSSVTVTDLCRPLISTFVQPVSLVQILIHILANVGKSVSRLSSERSRRGRLVNKPPRPPSSRHFHGIGATLKWRLQFCFCFF